MSGEEKKKAWLERKWNDPVWSKVIAGIILFILGGIGAVVVTLLHGWPAIWGWVKTAWTTVWHWVGGTASIPNWLLVVLSLCALAILAVVIVVIWAICRSPERVIQEITEFSYLGLKWRWQIQRLPDRDTIVNLYPYCPVCDMQLRVVRFRDVPRNQTKCFCDSCPGQPEKFSKEGEPEEVMDQVMREILRQRRKGILGKAEAPMPTAPQPTAPQPTAPQPTAPQPTAPQQSELHDLIFEGLKWYWRFQGKQVVDVKVVCPICDLDIKPFQENQYCPTLYRCPSCRTELKAYLGTHTELQERFVRHVLKGGC